MMLDIRNLELISPKGEKANFSLPRVSKVRNGFGNIFQYLQSPLRGFFSVVFFIELLPQLKHSHQAKMFSVHIIY